MLKNLDEAYIMDEFIVNFTIQFRLFNELQDNLYSSFEVLVFYFSGELTLIYCMLVSTTLSSLIVLLQNVNSSIYSDFIKFIMKIESEKYSILST